MHTPLAIYIASVAGAVALMLMMPQRQAVLRRIGAVLGAAALGGLWIVLGPSMSKLGDLSPAAFAYYYVFSAIAIIAAVRVITHRRPVYSALWFILVVLASAGLFLVLSAQFMAFAMVIIYAGAILVTYVFVIMLASQSSSDSAEASPDYDRVAREPIAATAAGFLLLAMILLIAFAPMAPTPDAKAPGDAAALLANRPEARLQQELHANQALPEGESAARVSNVEHIGLDLFRANPLGIELAGVILLMSLTGAVVIARTQVSEEEDQPPAAMPDESGAIAGSREEAGPHDPQTHGRSAGTMHTT